MSRAWSGPGRLQRQNRPRIVRPDRAAVQPAPHQRSSRRRPRPVAGLARWVRSVQPKRLRRPCGRRWWRPRSRHAPGHRNSIPGAASNTVRADTARRNVTDRRIGTGPSASRSERQPQSLVTATRSVPCSTSVRRPSQRTARGSASLDQQVRRPASTTVVEIVTKLKVASSRPTWSRA